MRLLRTTVSSALLLGTIAFSSLTLAGCDGGGKQETIPGTNEVKINPPPGGTSVQDEGKTPPPTAPK